MKRYAQIINNIVVHVIEAETDPDGTNGEWVACGNAGPGWSYVDNVFTSPAAGVITYKAWPAFEFYRKFTTEERVAIRTRAKTDPIVEDIYATLNAAIASGASIRDDDPDTVRGLRYLESIEDLAEGRAKEILS